MQETDQYYTEIRPKTDKFCNEIATLRSSKDISLGDQIIKHVDEYTNIINELISKVEDISSKVGALEDFKTKKQESEQKSRRKEWTLVIIGGIIGAVALALCEWIVSSFSKKT